MTRSKRTHDGSQTRVRCRALAHGTSALPTELNGAPKVLYCVLKEQTLDDVALHTGLCDVEAIIND